MTTATFRDGSAAGGIPLPARSDTGPACEPVRLAPRAEG